MLSVVEFEKKNKKQSIKIYYVGGKGIKLAAQLLDHFLTLKLKLRLMCGSESSYAVRQRQCDTCDV